MHSLHERKNTNRLKGYDYSQAGAYYITTVVKDRECVLGIVERGVMIPSPLGIIVQEAWNDLTNHYPNVRLDAFCIMPNHVHGIIVINFDLIVVEAGLKPASTTNTQQRKNHGLSEIVRGFKTFSSRRINEYCHTVGQAFWQRIYYDRIIRDEKEKGVIAEYIRNNPCHWEQENV
jgi:putative transposase